MSAPGIGYDDVAKGIWGLLMTVLGYLGLTTRSDVADLKRDAVNKADHDRTIDRIEATMKEHRQETTASLSRIFERLDTIVDRLPPK